PGPDSVADIGPVVLSSTPAPVAVTLTSIVQLELAARFPPVRLTLPDPGTATTAPPQLLESPFGVPITSPTGRLSVKATPLNATPCPLVRERLSVVFWLPGFVGTPKLLIGGGGLTTLRFADAVFPVPPLVEVTLPVVLVNGPVVFVLL